MSVMTRSQGFTLVEILIAVVIFSIGLLGIAGLQVAGMRFTHGSQLRTIAVGQVESMADLMRANLFAVQNGKYNVKDTAIPQTTTPDCATVVCNSTERAAYDLKVWNYHQDNSPIQSNADALPLGNGVVCRDSTPNDGASGNWACDNSGDVYAIKVEWQERTVGGNDVGKAGRSDADKLTQRFVMTVVPGIDITE